MARDRESSPRPIFTSSWDDGHPFDLRLADMLARHGFGGTFFVPLSNRPGLPVMNGAQIRELHAGGFEIGSHTLDHRYLTQLGDSRAAFQIAQGKAELEQIVGQEVTGFCYPGGKHHKRHVEMVSLAGFRYARNTIAFHTDVGQEPFAMPVSLQYCEYHPNMFLRNFARHGAWSHRRPMLMTALLHRDLLTRLKLALDVVCMRNGVFHLWGHSRGLHRFDGWAVLDEFLRHAAERIPMENRLSNFDTMRRKNLLAGHRQQPSGKRDPVIEGGIMAEAIGDLAALASPI